MSFKYLERDILVFKIFLNFRLEYYKNFINISISVIRCFFSSFFFFWQRNLLSFYQIGWSQNLAKPKRGAGNAIQVPHIGGRNLVTWALTSAPRCLL